MSEQCFEFVQWLKEEYGLELSPEQAVEKRQALLGMMRLVYQPLTEKEYNEIQEWRKQKCDQK